MGIQMGSLPSEFTEKIISYAENISKFNFTALCVGMLAILIIIFGQSYEQNTGFTDCNYCNYFSSKIRWTRSKYNWKRIWDSFFRIP